MLEVLESWLAAAAHLLLLVVLVPLLLALSPLVYLGYKLSTRFLSHRNPPAMKPFDMAKASYKTFYFTTSDGVKIAVDIWQPIEMTDAKPVMVNAQRYWRSVQLRFPFNYLPVFGRKPLSLVESVFIGEFLKEGYSVIVYDVRGSGASFGTFAYPWNERELHDAHEILAWVGEQSFCNGQIGLWGTSYCAMHAMLTSLRASQEDEYDDILYPKSKQIFTVCSLFAFAQIYSEIGYVGGIHLHSFLECWQQFLNHLDLHEFWRESIAILLVVESVTPSEAPGQNRLRLRKLAREEHKSNWQPAEDTLECIDDAGTLSGKTSLEISPDMHFESTIAAGKLSLDLAPDYLHVTGWFDSSVLGALRYFELLRGTHQYLVIGPWTHAGLQHIRPYENRPVTYFSFNFAELLRRYVSSRLEIASHSDMLIEKEHDSPEGGENSETDGIHASENNRLLKTADIVIPGDSTPTEIFDALSADTPIVYYVMQAELWRTCSQFPPVDTSTVSYRISSQPLRADVKSLSRENCKGRRPHLSLEPDTLDMIEREAQSIALAVDPISDEASYGSSRWAAVAKIFTPVTADYDHGSLNHLRFTSPPLDEDTEVTGTPTIAVWLSTEEVDADVFVSLQCLDISGKAIYVTEGCLKLKQRQCSNLACASQDIETSTGAPVLPERTFLRKDMLETAVSTPELVWFPLLPTSFLFRKGQTIRIAIYDADKSNFTPAAKKRYDLHVWTRSESSFSRIFLPVRKNAASRDD